jgi:hypothetical protein
VAAGSLLVLGVDALVRQQLAPSRYCRPPLAERYRVADDLAEPLAVVVAAAERDASTLRSSPSPLDRLVLPARIGPPRTRRGGRR